MSFSQSSHPWFGTWPVMLTPMHQDQSVDFNGLDALTDYYIDAGCTGLFACCQSSEIYHLAEQEKMDIARGVMRRAAGRVPVVAGAIGQQDEKTRLEVVKQLASLGVLCVVLVTGEFAAADESDEVLCERLERFAAAVPDIPLGLYECPQPYHRLLTAELAGRLARTGRFIWLKETSRDPVQQQAKIKAMQGTGCCLFNANTGLIRKALVLGATGHSGPSSNLSGLLSSALCLPQADPQQADLWFNALSECHELASSDRYLPGAKTLMGMRGLPITPACRKSKLVLSAEVIEQLAAHFARLVELEEEVLRSGLISRANPCA